MHAKSTVYRACGRQARMTLYCGLTKHRDAIRLLHAPRIWTSCACCLSLPSRPHCLLLQGGSAVISRPMLLRVADQQIAVSLTGRLFTSWLVVTAIPVHPGIWMFSFPGIQKWKSPGILGAREMGAQE